MLPIASRHGVVDARETLGDQGDADDKSGLVLPTLLATDSSSCRGTHGRSSKRVCRDDFEVRELLGSGAFGEVKLVKCKLDEAFYAMKAVDKGHLRERKEYLKDSQAVEHAQIERDIGVAACQWNCPFIVQLSYAFQTNEKLYYIFEYCSGGDLKGLIDVQPDYRLSETDVRFYLAEVTVALRHLHEHDFVHRDVKLENVLLAADGHVKLADFGSAKVCGSAGQRASFMPAYDNSILMPPEFLRGEICGKEMDCWQLGVMAFVMLAGSWPHRSPDGAKPWPGELPKDVSVDAGGFCAHLLQEVRSNRLGFPAGASKLSEHAFFAHIDWEKVEQKQIEPPQQAQRLSGVPIRDTVRNRGIYDFLRMPRFSFARKTVFGNSTLSRSRSWTWLKRSSSTSNHNQS